MLKAPPQQTATATIDTLSGRLQSATLLEDRRAAIQGLRSFAKQYPASVASGSLRELISTLKRDGLGDASSSHGQDDDRQGTEGGDVDTIRLVLETLLMLFNPDSNSPEAGDEIALFLADEFSMRQDNITLLLNLLDPTSAYADYYSRLYSVQILSSICAARPDRLQECILSAPLGLSRLVGVLDDSRDAVRNAGLLLLVDLTSGANEELRKIVAFEDVFGKTFSLIQLEGGLSEAGITAQDCLTLLANLVKGSASNQTMFRESGCVAQLMQLLQQSFPGDDELPTETQARERAAWGVLQLLRLFLISGESSTPQNQVAFFRAGTGQILIDLGFSAALPTTIRATALRAAAALIDSNPPLQEQFASSTVVTPADAEHNEAEAKKHAQTNGTAPNGRASAKTSARPSVENRRTYVIEALLDLALDQATAEEALRGAACGLIQAYLTNHDRIKAHFLQRAIGGHAEGETAANVIVTLLHPSDNDDTGVVHASWIVQGLIVDQPEAKAALLAVKEGDEEEGEDVITAVHGFGSQLQAALQTPVHVRQAAVYSSLLASLLWDFAPGVDDLLEEGSSLIQALVATVKTPTDPIVAGLSAVLLGVIYEFSTKDSPIPRRTLAPLLQQKLGRAKYLDALLQLRREPAIRDFDLDAESDEAGDGMLSNVFVDLFTVEYTRLRRAIDKDPGVEVIPGGVAEAGVDRDILDELRQQAQAAKDALATAQQEAVEATQKAEQDRMSISKELQTSKSEVERLRKINQAMQQGHESEIEKLTKKHEQDRNTAQTRHQHVLNSAKQEAERETQAKLREREATAAQKVQELEQRIAELGNEHRKEASGHASVKQQLETLSGKHNELLRRERDLSKELESLHQQRGAADRKLQAVQDQVKAAESKLDIARKSLDTRGEELEKLKSQVAELQADLKARDEELKTERAGYAELEKELDTAKAAALDAAMGEKQQLEEAQKKAEDAETKVKALETQLSEAKSGLEDAEKKASESESKFAAVQKRATDAESAFKEANKKATNSETKVKEVESKVADAEKKASEAEKKLSTTENKVKDLQKKLKDAEEKAGAAEKKAAESAKALKAKPTLSKEDKDKIAKADKLEKDLADAKKQVEVAKKALAAKGDAGKDDAVKLAQLESDLATKDEELTKAQESEKAAKEQLSQVEEDLDTVKKELEESTESAEENLKKTKQELEEAKASSEEELEKTKAELAEAKKAAEKQLQKTKKELEAAKEAAESDLESIKSELQAAKTAAESTKAELEKSQKALEQAQKQAQVAKDLAKKATDDAKKAAAESSKELDAAKKAASEAANKKNAGPSQADKAKLATLEKAVAEAKENEKQAKEELESAIRLDIRSPAMPPFPAELHLLNHGRPLEDRIHYPTMMAWEGEGVWILNLSKDNIDEYGKFPPTFDMDEHRENLKKMGATWYPDARDHPEAAMALRAMALEREACSHEAEKGTAKTGK
ncbi:Intracellular protein transport protein USO1 [Pseudocercospora fuligena]|uniref:Intracellular protein transport protein USO1 n=1 Tax=Pseudocercospora fuligena TaxID=685502 RepID=A0A8H6RDM3_9PEZI|nr:Intracellular protein transport protein USO1 [Pseudocercospora fuligena]